MPTSADRAVDSHGPSRLKPAFLGILVAILTLFANGSFAVEKIPLAGQWQFALDRDDAGIREHWFNRGLPDKIQLPGALQSQGFGDEIGVRTPWVLSLYDRLWYLREDYMAYTNAGSVKVPFVCQPPRHYLGAAWYQREIEIPKDWEGRRVVLFLERPHWESRVWLDDQLIGTNNSLCAPHEFEIGLVNLPGDVRRPGIAPGKHKLTVRVDNRLVLPYRPDAHAISDSLASTWNGIVGRMELQASDTVRIEQLRLQPDLKRNGVEVTLFVRNDTEKTVAAPLVMLQVVPKNFGGDALKSAQQAASIEPGKSTLTLFFSLGEGYERWSEFNPKFYRLRATIGGKGFHSEIADVFGMREFKAEGHDFVINGRRTYLRGTHHGGDFPLTGYPPTDVEYWRKLVRTCKDWGLNHIRFHSFCPPDAAFEAADEFGFYLQVEPGMWNTFDPGSAMEKMLYLETERIIRAYGNHPSFVMLSPSNEPKGRWRQVLPRWAEHFREIDPRRLYSSGTGFTDSDAPGPLDKVDYTSTSRFGPRRVRGESAWFGRDYSSALAGVKVPVIAHELGQWCAYPDYDVIRKFTGYMRPGNYEIFRASARAHGLFSAEDNLSAPTGGNANDDALGVNRPTNHDFTWASGRFQLACYKEEIEANLRTPGLAGFQLLDLHDYVGQGTALVGLLDPFWESKGYVTPKEFRTFCGPTVPLARLSNRTFTTADPFEAEAEIAHYGATDLTNATATWEIKNQSGQTVVRGDLGIKAIPIGRSVLGKIVVDLSKLAAPQAYRLVVNVRARDAQPGFENEWTFWLYPSRDTKPVPQDILVTSSWDEAQAKLAGGGKVLFLPRNTDLDWTSPPLGAVPVFWNRLMNPAWSRMLGLWCDTNHPALAEFPTEANCDWQWTQMIRGVRPVNLDRLPRGLQPIVQAIDDWNRNWKLGALFECRVGKGRLMVSAFDVADEPQDRPVARQLFRSLLDYMAGEQFQPKTEVSAAEFQTVLFDTRIMRKLEAKAEGEDRAANAIDGDPNTYWLAGGSGRNASGSKYPHPLTIRFPKPVAMTGIVLMPRQNDRDHLGDVREYKFEFSDDGEHWTEVSRGELPSSWNPHRIEFGRTITVRQLRFTALSGYGDDTSAALAELAVIYAGPKLTDRGAGNIEYRSSRSTSADVDEGGEAITPRTNAIQRNP